MRRGIGMTWGELLADGQEQLKNAGIAEFNLDAWYLFEKAFGISRMQYFLRSVQNAEPTEDALEFYNEGILRRSKREPLQHILGTQEFMGLEFYVNRHTLIPRQDTETLVETVLAAHKEKNIRLLDMCTGSGCIAISLAAHGKYAHVEAADISIEALKVAEKNAETILHDAYCLKHAAAMEEEWYASDANLGEIHMDKITMDETNAGGGKRFIRFRHTDMFSAFNPKIDKFDIIVSNPPYIPSDVIEELEPEVRDFEPRSALDGTADGLFFYEKLAKECGQYLNNNGSVYFEIGHDQGESVENLLKAHGFTDTRVIKDLAGNDRVVCGRKQTVDG